MKTYNCEFMHCKTMLKNSLIKSTIEYTFFIQFFVPVEISHRTILIKLVSHGVYLPNYWDKVIDSYRTVHV